MKVKELIEILEKLHPDTLVLVDGYEGGYTELESIFEKKVSGPINTDWYYGEYEEPNSQKENQTITKAVLLSRY